MTENRSPGLDKTAFVCPHCKAHALQHWYGLGAYRRNGAPPLYTVEKIQAVIKAEQAKPAEKRSADNLKAYKKLLDSIEHGDPAISDDDTRYMSPIDNSNISVCFACKRETLWIADKIIYPVPSGEAPEPNPDLPTEVRNDYLEAAQVLKVSPRSAAALLRLALEKMCGTLLGQKADINTMIGTLVERGLNPTIQQALDVVRVVGNEAVHPGTLDLKDDVETTGRLFLLINLIAEAMISHPKHVAELYKIIPENKLKGIEQRDKPKLLSSPE